VPGSGGAHMIQLTRLNNQPLIVNSDLIKFVEHAPDTVLTLVTGEKVVVRETSDEVLQKITSFRRGILAGLGAEKSSDAAANPPCYPAAELGEEKS
jgi:flagellar protein FlbD